MFQRQSKFSSEISSGGSIFLETLVPGGTNLVGSIFAVTGPGMDRINVGLEVREIRRVHDRLGRDISSANRTSLDSRERFTLVILSM